MSAFQQRIQSGYPSSHVGGNNLSTSNSGSLLHSSQSNVLSNKNIKELEINGIEDDDLSKAIAAETQVKQYLFEHFQRVSMGSYPRETSLAILKENIKHSIELINALGRIQTRASSKGTNTNKMPQKLNSRNQFGALNSYVNGSDGKPNPPLVKQRLNMEMATSLLRQGDGSTLNAFQDFESEANKVTEEELAQMSELDRRIYLTLKHCESISIRLRHSLQENLKVLLESNSLPSANDPNNPDQLIPNNSMSNLTGGQNGDSNWLPSKPIESPTLEDKSEEEIKRLNEHIVREQPNILQLALKEYQLVVSKKNIKIYSNFSNLVFFFNLGTKLA